MKIVQEGGLEPLTQLMRSDDIEILREVAAALANLSLSDENKYEVAKSGAIGVSKMPRNHTNIVKCAFSTLFEEVQRYT